MVNSKRDLNLKVDGQRNIKQFDQTIVLCVVIKMIISKILLQLITRQA